MPDVLANILKYRDFHELNNAELAGLLKVSRSLPGKWEAGEAYPRRTKFAQFAKAMGMSLEELQGDYDPGKLTRDVKLAVSEPAQKQWGDSMVVDTAGLRVIPIVDIKAAAGKGYINPEVLEETDVIRLPTGMVKGVNPMAIRVKGPSMAPTLQDGGLLAITLVNKGDWINIRDKFIYVIVDAEGATYVKRLRNRFSNGFIVCTSDNPDKQSFPNFNLQHNEIQFIWNVEMYFTHKMPNIHDQYYSRLQNLEDEVIDMRNQFAQIQKRLK